MKRTIAALMLGLAGFAPAEAPARTHGDGLQLTLAVPESKPALTFRIAVINTGQVAEIVYGPFANYTRLNVVRPSGERKEVFNWKEMATSPSPLNPGERQEWDIQVKDWVELIEPGEYQLSFTVNGKESNQIILIKDGTPNQALEGTGDPRTVRQSPQR